MELKDNEINDTDNNINEIAEELEVDTEDDINNDDSNDNDD